MAEKKRISKFVWRISHGFNNVDLVRTSAGFFRVGSMPGLSKIMRRFRLSCDHVVVLPPEVTPAGDNHTGEEFVLRMEICSAHPRVRQYFGRYKDLLNLQRRLANSVNTVFNAERDKLVEIPHTSTLMKLRPLNLLGVASFQKVEIVLKDGNVEIYDDHRLVYDLRASSAHVNVHYMVERLFERIPRKQVAEPGLSLLVCGNGDGFGYVTSNFIVSYGQRKIWVDVPACPALILSKHKIHLDDITDYLVTHVHEDHVEGLSAVIRRAASTKNRINLITSQSIYKALKENFDYMFHRHFDRYVNFVHLTPDSSLPYFKGTIHCRRNHHDARSGTLGLKFEHNGQWLGISGDTLYDEALVKRLEKPSLSAKWFRKCGLVLHDVEFKDRHSVHPYFREVQKLQQLLEGKVLVYHTHERKSLMPLAKEGCLYVLRDGKLRKRTRGIFHLP